MLRYSIFTAFILLIISVIRFALIPQNPLLSIFDFFVPSWEMFMTGFPTAGIFVISAFGAGWGTIITLASFNKFKTKTVQNSWIICVGQMFIFLSFGYIVYVTDRYYNGEFKMN